MLGPHHAIHAQGCGCSGQATTSDAAIFGVAKHPLAEEEVLGSALCRDRPAEEPELCDTIAVKCHGQRVVLPVDRPSWCVVSAICEFC